MSLSFTQRVNLWLIGFFAPLRGVTQSPTLPRIQTRPTAQHLPPINYKAQGAALSLSTEFSEDPIPPALWQAEGVLDELRQNATPEEASHALRFLVYKALEKCEHGFPQSAGWLEWLLVNGAPLDHHHLPDNNVLASPEQLEYPHFPIATMAVGHGSRSNDGFLLLKKRRQVKNLASVWKVLTARPDFEVDAKDPTTGLTALAEMMLAKQYWPEAEQSNAERAIHILLDSGASRDLARQAIEDQGLLLDTVSPILTAHDQHEILADETIETPTPPTKPARL